MNAADFDALEAAARASLAARIIRGVHSSLGAARNTSLVAHHLECGLARWRSANTAERLRAGLLIVGIAALTHVVLVLPAPAPARSALPLVAPLIMGAVALLGAFAIRPDRRS